MQNTAPIIAWVADPIDLYFAQIQGSVVIELRDKRTLLLSYAGNNGYAYVSIGKWLVDHHEMARKIISMQTIRQWLKQHPDRIMFILNQNPSYVFFTLAKNGEPLGTQNVPLTPQRSLAVDMRYIPLGAPVWLNTSVPDAATQSTLPFRQLLIAQDSGGAIKGVVRGDVYWGFGEQAEYNAGHMQSRGQYWLLLPAVSTLN